MLYHLTKHVFNRQSVYSHEVSASDHIIRTSFLGESKQLKGNGRRAVSNRGLCKMDNKSCPFNSCQTSLCSQDDAGWQSYLGIKENK